MGKVVGVRDGDTLSVLVGGQMVKIRPAGIDAPEKRQPTSPGLAKKLN